MSLKGLTPVDETLNLFLIRIPAAEIVLHLRNNSFYLQCLANGHYSYWSSEVTKMAFIKVGNCLITISKRRALDAISKFAVLGGDKN